MRGQISRPPNLEWYQGRTAIRNLLNWAWPETGFTAFRLVPTRANGQAHAIQVLSHDNQEIAVLTRFMDIALFSAFGRPEVINS